MRECEERDIARVRSDLVESDFFCGEVVGQPETLRLLQRALETGRIAHAYLFAGPSGVGKKTLALCFARALNCLRTDMDCTDKDNESGPDDKPGKPGNRAGFFAPCGTCPSCRKIANGNHPDVKVISPDGASVRIDQIREIKREMSYRPYEGRYRVWIIEDCDKMTEQAANSILKVLEEPQERTVFILLASNVLSILPTIVSRCQILRFYPVGASAISGLLESRYGIPREEARVMAFLCHGSVGKAVGWATGRIPLPPRDEVIALAGSVLGQAQAGYEAGRGGGMLEALRNAGELEKRKDDLDEILDLLEDWYRDLMIVYEAAHDGVGLERVSLERVSLERGIPHETEGLLETLVINVDKLEVLEEQARMCSTDRAVNSIGVIEAARQGIRRNANLRLALENMLFALIFNV
ncbi:MAG: DNA polymerase III subunit delta' [Firmicutes bacterium]|nr:DNA polymerase III subunit delta' [Bacillota bacterium]